MKPDHHPKGMAERSPGLSATPGQVDRTRKSAGPASFGSRCPWYEFPSPRPSPEGEGESSPARWRIVRASDFHETANRTPSPFRERAGVRGIREHRPGALLNLHPKPSRYALVVALAWLLLFCAGAPAARAALQFDVFLGYDGIVPEASWFPVVCEIKNDGPSFTGMVELSGGSDNAGQTRRLTVELPTGTLKRVVLPAFAAGRSYRSTWEVRLLDERGKVRAEQSALPIRKQLAAGHAAHGRALPHGGRHAGHPPPAFQPG